MQNHFHLLISAPRANLSQAMMYFLRETSRNITRPIGRINQTYGNRFYRCLIDDDHYFRHAYKYVYRNPVEVGVVSRVEDYPFSTLHGLLGRSKLIIPVINDSVLMSDPDKTLGWLNTSPTRKNAIAVSRALRKVSFRLAGRNKRAHQLEFEDY